MRQSIHPMKLFEAIEAHGFGAFAHLCTVYPEEAVMRAFLRAERHGLIERVDGKLSHARLARVTRIGHIPHLPMWAIGPRP